MEFKILAKFHITVGNKRGAKAKKSLWIENMRQRYEYYIDKSEKIT